jgi:hypothetical protein
VMFEQPLSKASSFYLVFSVQLLQQYFHTVSLFRQKIVMSSATELLHYSTYFCFFGMYCWKTLDCPCADYLCATFFFLHKCGQLWTRFKRPSTSYCLLQKGVGLI